MGKVFSCPRCDRTVPAGKWWRTGSRKKCPKCGSLITVPELREEKSPEPSKPQREPRPGRQPKAKSAGPGRARTSKRPGKRAPATASDAPKSRKIKRGAKSGGAEPKKLGLPVFAALGLALVVGVGVVSYVASRGKAAPSSAGSPKADPTPRTDETEEAKAALRLEPKAPSSGITVAEPAKPDDPSVVDQPDPTQATAVSVKPEEPIAPAMVAQPKETQTTALVAKPPQPEAIVAVDKARDVYTNFAARGSKPPKDDIVALDRDEHGNLAGARFDLAKDHSFEGYRIALLQLYSTGTFDFAKPRLALKEKGFVVHRWTTLPAMAELRKVLNTSCQLWVISNRDPFLTEEHVAEIRKFFESGRGVYIWGDNQPYYADANRVAQACLGCSMAGNTPGRQVVRRRTGSGKSGFLEHLITTGLDYVCEGFTIATIQPSEKLQPLLYGSAGNLVIAIHDAEGRRAILDGGFTRLYCNWDTAGTGRYVKNAACWLVNYERFGPAAKYGARAVLIQQALLKGQAFEAAGKLVEARDTYQQAVKAYPGDPLVVPLAKRLSALTPVLAGMAESEIRSALVEGPRLVAQNKHLAAWRVYNTASKRWPTAQGIAEVQARLERLSPLAAEQASREALDAGLALEQAGQREQALAKYREVLARFPNAPQTTAPMERAAAIEVSQAIAKAKQSTAQLHFGEARRIYEEVIQRYPNAPQVAELRQRKAELGSWTDAQLRSLDLALRRAERYQKRARGTSGARYLKSVLRRWPKIDQVPGLKDRIAVLRDASLSLEVKRALSMGKNYERYHRYDRARRVYEELIRKYPNSAALDPVKQRLADLPAGRQKKSR